MADALLLQSLIVIFASVVAVGLLARIGLPALVGYILAGLLIGPHGLGLLTANEETKFLAELGVVFLMFMVGLEFSFAAMIEARRDVFIAGGLQVLLTVAAVTGAAWLAGVAAPSALLLGGAVAMSSTAITHKQIADQGLVNSAHARLAMAILLFQDLAALPFLVAVGAWHNGLPDTLHILTQLGIAALVLVAAAFVCGPIFRAVLNWVALTNSKDLFLLCVLGLAFGTAFGVDLAGLAPAIGAFIAGLVVGESDFRHQVEDDIRPFRDVLLGLFFVTIGLEVDPSTFLVAPLAVLFWMLVFVPGKALLALLVGTMLRWPAQVNLRVAIVLAHAGEFGLLLLTQAMMVGAIDPAIGQPALLALALTMALGPILIQQSAWIEQGIGGTAYRMRAGTDEAAVHEQGMHLSDHVLLCGCGRIGRQVALVLEAATVAYIAVESDFQRFRQAKGLGHKVVFGDASRNGILNAAGIDRARVVVVTFDHRRAVERILHHARHSEIGAASIVSAADEREVNHLVDAGAGTVFPENLAAGLALADQVLLFMGMSQEEAARVVTTVRAELMPELKGRVGIW